MNHLSESKLEEESELSEQEAVIRCICEEDGNCVVSANPGTGKTTTILSAAERAPMRQFLVLTYNNSLQVDTARSVQSRGMKNVEVCTYHQYVHSRYDSSVCDDWGIVNVLRGRGAKLHPPTLSVMDAFADVKPTAAQSDAFDVLVVDEAQDMCRLYFLVVALAAVDAKKKFQLVVMGDARQGVYAFRGADTRFLSLTPQIWAGFPHLLKPHLWRTIHFTVTHRLPPAICHFLNEGMEHGLGENSGARLVPSASAAQRTQPVAMCVDSTSNCVIFVLNSIRMIREKFQCALHDIAVLCPSLHADACVKEVMQELTLQDVPIYVANGAVAPVPVIVPTISDLGAADLPPCVSSSSSEDSVRFYTFWSAKGLTVRFAIAINPNNNYFVMRDDDRTRSGGSGIRTCPSPHFVSFSRASEMLFVVYAYDAPATVSSHARRTPLSSNARGQLLPPYLRSQLFRDTPRQQLRLVGEKVGASVHASRLSDAATAAAAGPPIAAAPDAAAEANAAAGVRRPATGSRKFSVTQLCAFLSSEFIASELGELYTWFDRSVLTDPPINAADCAPSFALNAFHKQEDVSDLNGKILAYYGYDYLNRRCGATTNPPPSALDFAMRQVTPRISTDVRKRKRKADELLSRFDRMRLAHRTCIADYVHAVCVMEAVQSGMYYRALHFPESKMNWIPDAAVRQFERVIDHFMTSTTGKRGGEEEEEEEEPTRYDFEEPFFVRIPDVVEGTEITLQGRIDVVAHNDALYEWKYKTALQLEDFLQLLIYCFVKTRANPDFAALHAFRLLNLRTGEAFTLREECRDMACKAVEALLRVRCAGKTQKEDDDDDAAAVGNKDDRFAQKYSMDSWKGELAVPVVDDDDDEDDEFRSNKKGGLVDLA